MVLDEIDDRTTFCSISTFLAVGLAMPALSGGQEFQSFLHASWYLIEQVLIRHNYPDKVFQGYLGIEIRHHRTCQKRAWWFQPMAFRDVTSVSRNVLEWCGRISASIAAGKRPAWTKRNRLGDSWCWDRGRTEAELVYPWERKTNGKHRHQQRTWRARKHPRYARSTSSSAGVHHPIGHHWLSRFGRPHHRQRLITIGTNIPNILEEVEPGPIFSPNPTRLHPSLTHGSDRKNPHLTLRDVIGHMPKLDSLTNQTCDDDPYHQIPKWNKNHHFWMKHTPEGSTAFENDACPNCGFQVDDRSLVNCPECKSDLPRPTVEFVGWKCKKCGEKNRKSKLVCQCGAAYSGKKFTKQRRLIRGFKTSYRRLTWDKPSSTITMNSGVISSDMKGHPDQNRVLSVREILMLSTLQNHPAASYEWGEKYEFKSKKAGMAGFMTAKCSETCTTSHRWIHSATRNGKDCLSLEGFRPQNSLKAEQWVFSCRERNGHLTHLPSCCNRHTWVRCCRGSWAILDWDGLCRNEGNASHKQRIHGLQRHPKCPPNLQDSFRKFEWAYAVLAILD